MCMWQGLLRCSVSLGSLIPHQMPVYGGPHVSVIRAIIWAKGKSHPFNEEQPFSNRLIVGGVIASWLRWVHSLQGWLQQPRLLWQRQVCLPLGWGFWAVVAPRPYKTKSFLLRKRPKPGNHKTTPSWMRLPNAQLTKCGAIKPYSHII